MNMLDALGIRRHRITVDQYHSMGEAGIFSPDARVELIEGEIVDMAAIGTKHWAAVNRLNQLLVQAVGDHAIVSTQSSVRLDNWSEPEPDVALYKPRDDYYASRHPTGIDALLVIEVSDTTLDYDMRVKAPLYARHGVSNYWIFDLNARVLRVFRAPGGDAYHDVTSIERPGVVSLPGLSGVTIDLTGVL